MKAWAALRILVAYLFLLVYVLIFLVVACVTFKWGVRGYFHLFARLFGRTYLAIVGVKIHSPNQNILNQRSARVVAMNHSSQLDFFVGAAIMPPWGTVIAKKEVLKIPLLGWAMALLDLVTIDRANPEQARKTMAEAAERIRTEDASILIAPEGTRSGTGEIGPFKMGAFHLAQEVDVPLVVVLFRSPHTLQPLGTQLVRPGTISVEVLDTVHRLDVARLSPHELRDRVRSTYLTALGQERPTQH